ncbi:hypothetical protein GH741_11035 [Aquibacillus halophilus]|uniref:Uncharacterized protein n=1 Tax=Aquibacillus halophilus TaxID=930132 RepID=A0A6A8DCE6_9BACI|nr:hypothetical protein [Aquibacillus halophilus]MRH43214.1 hypothetical protein [Aquibacillus halophilus]
MTVNHAGTLKKEYFVHYINLIKNSRHCSLDQAKELTLELFFKNDHRIFGQETYQQFLLAYQELKQ